MSTLDQSQVAGSTLGYAQITSNFTTTSTTAVQVTGLSITVTVPSGGRRVKITAWAETMITNGAANIYWQIWQGTVGSGTLLSRAQNYLPASTGANNAIAIAVITPSAGSYTYNVGCYNTQGATAGIEATSTYPAFIMAELI